VIKVHKSWSYELGYNVVMWYDINVLEDIADPVFRVNTTHYMVSQSRKPKFRYKTIILPVFYWCLTHV
jgi:hypothetical protein